MTIKELVNCRVSIITPAFNSEGFIELQYRLLCKQSFSNWEWMLTDDSSSDQTFRLLKDLESQDLRVHVARNSTNLGAAVARNKSLIAATGDFIAFLDADDVWIHDKLEKQLNFMVSSNLNFSFTAYSLIDAHGRSLGKVIDCQKKRVFTYDDMLKKEATMGCSTVMLRRSAFPNLQMPLIRTGQDYALWLSLLRNGATAHLLPEVLTHYRITPNSISRNKVKKALRQWEIYRKFEGLSVFKSLYYFVHYAYHAVFRR